MERSIYRIIDANFNRAREGARVMEEYCRFALNSSVLSGRAKQLRHQLCRTAQRLDSKALITSRQSDSDVGCEIKVDSQHQRKSLQDCFTAGAKRLTEALRVLAEMTQTIDPSIAAEFEKLRFAAYTLEKDVVLASDTMDKVSEMRLYVLITASLSDNSQQLIELTKACAAGGADCLQLRAKGLSDGPLLDLAGDFTKICNDYGVTSIINDRVAIAIAANADGVHFGQDDLPVNVGRKLQFKPMIFGLSTHSIEQLRSAIEIRPDYVGVGPVFPTVTKPSAKTVGLEYVSSAVDELDGTGIAHVAIGGITTRNVADVIKAGAKAVAVCSEVSQSPDPQAQCRKLKNIILSG